MPEHVKPMLKKGEVLEQEFVSLGESFLRDTFEHLSATAEARKGAEWQNFAFTAQAGRRVTQWEEHIKSRRPHRVRRDWRVDVA